MSKTLKFISGLIIFLILAGIFVRIFSHFYVNFQWFNDLGYSQLYTIPLLTKIVLFGAMFLVSFAIIYPCAILIVKIILNHGYNSQDTQTKIYSFFSFDDEGEFKSDIIENKKSLSKNNLFILVLISGALSAMIAGLFMQAGAFLNTMQFINSTNFNIIDPIFNNDLSFYIFKLPFITTILNVFVLILSMIIIGSLALFFMFGVIDLEALFKKEGTFLPLSAKRLLATTLGFWFIAFAFNKYISIYSQLYSKTGYVFGASNTDVNIAIPLTKFLALLSLIAGIFCFVYNFKNDKRFIIGTVSVYIVISILSGVIIYGYQNYYVSNNEFVAEKPYIENEIKYTNMAYGLDKIKTKDYPGKAKLTMENIEQNDVIMNNIRLNDPKALSPVLSQTQGLRYYYNFGDIDIDRYNINDNYRQVLISAREMDNGSLRGKADTFINQTMRYTHGYGVAATLANDFDESGYAKLLVKDVPPKSRYGDLEVKQPRIYFGEQTIDRKYKYVLGNTDAQEFDYPQGDANVENTYKGETGLEFNPLNKFALSVYYTTPKFYLAGEINQDSKLLMRRNIRQRVQTLMPYLRYDNDPYIVIGEDGKLYWIMDAYTKTNRFPYSNPISRDINYLRNSVKVVIDAYNGTVNFYTFNKDPVLRTLKGIFPNTFKSADEMPSNLKDHIRYPEGLFRIQSNILKDFHMKDPYVFYNKEDSWDVAKKALGNQSEYVDPYYTVMRLPNEETGEFVLMRPFTPVSRGEQKRNNLIAWLAARNDGDKYGELLLYRMPKNIEVQGPLMIDSMIDQDPDISRQLTLWGQGGSRVIRGNLLVVPMDKGFIYVEPIYIESDREGGSIPQLQAIIFAIDKKIVMVETNELDEAVAGFFGEKGDKVVGAKTEEDVETEEDIDETKDDEDTKTVKVIEKEEIIEKIKDLMNQLEGIKKDVQELQ